MLVYAFSVLNFLILGLSSAEETDLFLKTCKLNSKDYSACLKDSVQSALPHLVKGIPQYDLPPLDPLFIKYQKITFNLNNMNGEIIFIDFSVTGLSNVNILNITSNFFDDIFHLEIDAEVPKLDIETIMKLNSSLSVFKLVSESPVHVTISDIKGKVDLTGHVINDRWVLDHFRVYPTIEKFTISADNLIEGNKQLNDLVINFMNEYWPMLYRSAMPFLSDKLDMEIVKILNQFFSHISFSNTFI